MRPPHLMDLDRAARAILDHAPAKRAGALARILASADIADRYRKRTGRTHPVHGDGTLWAATQRPNRPPSGQVPPGYHEALAQVAAALSQRRR